MSLQIIKQPYLISFSGNPIAFTYAITPYRTSERKKDYKIIVRIEVEEDFNSNAFNEVKELLLYPEENGCATVSIENVLNTFLEQKLPRLNQNILMPLTEQRKRYQVSYRLLNGTQLVDGSVNTSSIFYVIKGGFSYQEWHPKKFFTEKLVSDKTFLRFPAKKETVFADEYKYLTWISSLDATNMQSLYVIIGYSDGTQTAPTLLNSITLNSWLPCITAAGFNQLNLAALVDSLKTAIWYELYVTSDSVAVVCIPVTISPAGLPDGVVGTPYSGSISLSGSSPFSMISIVKPSWMTLTIFGSSIQLTGTPDAAATGTTVSFTINNCSGDSDSFSDSIDITEEAPPPITCNFLPTTFVSGDALNDVEIANFSGIPGASVVIKLDTLTNNNGGSLIVNSSTAFLNNTFTVVLDGSGNGSLNVSIAGFSNSPSVILGHFTIISVSSGSIGSTNTFQISKVF